MPKNNTVKNVLIALRQIMRAVDIHSKKLKKECLLTSPQLIVLNEIVKNRILPIGSLAKNVHLSNATVTGIVDRLEKRGLAQRTRGASDRRQVFIEATDIGFKTNKKAPLPLQEQFVKRFNALSGDEQNSILNAIEQVASMMNAEELDVGPILTGQPLSEAN